MKNKTEIMKSVNGVASKTVMKLKKHSPEILVVAGIAGTVVSAVLACKATTKVAEILDETKGTLDTMCETKSVTSSLYLDMNEVLPDVSKLEDEVAALKKKYADANGDYPFDVDDEIQTKTSEIAKGNDDHFIGKVGQFCPIKPGCGGGILLRETENKKTGEKGYAAATGSKGFRWLESEMVKQLDKQNDIDRAYYNNMVGEAVKSLSVYGDFERFAADEPYVSDNTPPWFGAGEPHEDDTTPFDVR